MTQRTFIFEDQLVMSDGVLHNNEDIPTYLLRTIPLAARTTRANADADRKGVDYWVELQSGGVVGVDVKVRDQDWSLKGEDDLALETWSVVENSVIGWTRDTNKQTDFILWIWKDTQRYVLLPFPWLCSIFETYWEEWKQQYRTARQRTQRTKNYQYHSECIFVPREVVWSKIYTTYGGIPT